jgi:hypothetical protein
MSDDRHDVYLCTTCSVLYFLVRCRSVLLTCSCLRVPPLSWPTP